MAGKRGIYITVGSIGMWLMCGWLLEFDGFETDCSDLFVLLHHSRVHSVHAV